MTLPTSTTLELRTLVPPIAVLRGDPARGMLRLRRLSAHVPPEHLRRSHRGVLVADQRRHALGRQRRADRRDHRPRRDRVHEPAHLPRPDEVRGQTGQVHARHRAGRRHRERPGAAARRREPLVARARRLRRRPLRDGRRGQFRYGRARRPPRGVPGPGARPEGQGRDARPVRRLGPRHEVLLVRRDRPGRDPGRDQPHRLDRGRRLRDLPARPEPRRRPVGADPRRGQAVRHPRDPLVGPTTDRGRHLRLGFGLRARDEPVRGHRAGASGRTAGRRLHRQGGARADPPRGRLAQARRDRARRAADRTAVAALAGVLGRRAGRPRHRRDAIHRAWRRTSATCGCRSGSPSPATGSISRPTTALAPARPRRSRSSTPRRRCPPPRGTPEPRG